MRAGLGQPFAPWATLGEKMRRLPPPAGSTAARRRTGALTTGPATLPDAESDPARVAVVTVESGSGSESGSETWRGIARGEFKDSKERIMRGVEDAMRAWGADEASSIAPVLGDLEAADAFRVGNAATPGELDACLKRLIEERYDVIVIDGGEDDVVRASARRARAEAAPRRRRRAAARV